ncbi:MAG: hypothetical protein MK179_15875 [Pirellulaceae bacterium]|nr:hypothetical protein [Pirellulaceae bacterium]
MLLQHSLRNLEVLRDFSVHSDAIHQLETIREAWGLEAFFEAHVSFYRQWTVADKIIRRGPL